MIAELRELLDTEPSQEAFRHIMLYLRRMEASSASDDTFLVALDYASQHLENWHPRSRFFEVRSPLVGASNKEPLLCLRLARSLSFHVRMLKDTNLICLVNDPGISNLMSINLWNNGITYAGVEALANSPHMTNLRELILGHNAISDAGAIALADSPYLANLRKLVLANCEITDVGALALARSSYLSQIETHAFHGNHLTDVGWSAIYKAW